MCIGMQHILSVTTFGTINFQFASSAEWSIPTGVALFFQFAIFFIIGKHLKQFKRHKVIFITLLLYLSVCSLVGVKSNIPSTEDETTVSESIAGLIGGTICKAVNAKSRLEVEKENSL